MSITETAIHLVSKISLQPIMTFEKCDDRDTFYTRNIIITGNDQEIAIKLFSKDKDTLEVKL